MNRRPPWRDPQHRLRAGLALAILVIGVTTVRGHLRIGFVEQDVVCLPGISVIAWHPSDEMPARGDLYAFLAPRIVERLGVFPTGQVFVKRVAGLPGDRVEIDREATRVNGRIVAHGLDLAGKLAADPAIFERAFTVRSGEVLLLGETRDSLDGRYFGGLKVAARGLGKGWALW